MRPLARLLSLPLLLIVASSCSPSQSVNKKQIEKSVNKLATCTASFENDYLEVDKAIKAVLSIGSNENAADAEIEAAILNLDTACKAFFKSNPQQIQSQDQQKCLSNSTGQNEALSGTKFEVICAEASDYVNDFQNDEQDDDSERIPGFPTDPKLEIDIDQLSLIKLQDLKPETYNIRLRDSEALKKVLRRSGETERLLFVYGEVVKEQDAKDDLKYGATGCVADASSSEVIESFKPGQLFPLDNAILSKKSNRETALIRLSENLTISCSKIGGSAMNFEDFQASVSGVFKIEKAR